MQDNHTLSSLGITEWNDMQLAAHKAIESHINTLLLAPTGSGKTFAYLLPVLRALKQDAKAIQCLILVPSRELGLQIEQVWKKMDTGFKVNCFYGGHPILTEIQNLSTVPALLIGTPGRIADHLRRETFDKSSITTLVLDEFDKSLSLGFEEDMAYIIGCLGNLNKRILVSATAAVEVPEFVGIQNIKKLDFINEQATSESLTVKTVLSNEKDKSDTLFQLLCYIGAEPAIIFCNHREAVERTSKLLIDKGIDNAFYHGGLEQIYREQSLVRFRNGSVFLLVSTDLAARGLDIPEVKNIIHYHLPHTKEEYIHRNGRTARMNATGTAYIILHAEEHLPEFIEGQPEEINLPISLHPPKATEWTTIYISGGKKDKINKVDIVGFFSKIGKLEKEDLGMIEVKDFISFAAVKKTKVKELLQKVQSEKMKGKKYRVAVVK